jgi:hypothetical protein
MQFISILWHRLRLLFGFSPAVHRLPAASVSSGPADYTFAVHTQSGVHWAIATHQPDCTVCIAVIRNHYARELGVLLVSNRFARYHSVLTRAEVSSRSGLSGSPVGLELLPGSAPHVPLERTWCPPDPIVVPPGASFCLHIRRHQ